MANKEQPPIHQTQTQTSHRPPMKKPKRPCNWLIADHAPSSPDDGNRSVEGEVNDYKDVRLRYHGDVDVLTWWGPDQNQFPRLSVLAAEYLAVPAASASCEWVFSRVSLMVAKRRRCLATPRLARMTYIWDNLDHM